MQCNKFIKAEADRQLDILYCIIVLTLYSASTEGLQQHVLQP